MLEREMIEGLEKLEKLLTEVRLERQACHQLLKDLKAARKVAKTELQEALEKEVGLVLAVIGQDLRKKMEEHLEQIITGIEDSWREALHLEPVARRRRGR
jgi:hypothetical protein